ncbi:MAG: hypothetical protein IPQ09_24405 [Myxococcales bacterium]|nr:hypothetical protein [Myxococcales bacterium]
MTRLRRRLARDATVALVAAASAVAAMGCAGARAFVASPADYEDYRAVRLAAHEGTRLGRARAYLQRHPRGAYAAEVQSLYASEEPAYFERVKSTPDGARDYLASLPGGPHALAASAILREDYERKDDIALARELRDGRSAEARFQRALEGRKAAAAAVYDALAAALDPALLGSEASAPPASFVAAARGAVPTLSGLPLEVERDLFFTLPGRVERPDRVLTLTFTRTVRGGRVTEARVEAEDLFVHWREADTAEALDPTVGRDRALGLAHARERLAGALEARFPAASCGAGGGPADTRDILVVLFRQCGGARVDVTAGRQHGVADVVHVRLADAAVTAP